ncbi:MAG TPA: cell division ATP-binding protein FtsE [Candidatus Eisenbacteria bacterium]|uniref:Cell division ATP-binding protein FtsE n=1 Tax=Eiseniibacteriota bacterium TaxID=2212470 RepID=A0A7V2AUH2_UNCEI|nr:cell division ATP-binding protein FtsE [Candidatus Eisenbacteria bacterium]
MNEDRRIIIGVYHLNKSLGKHFGLEDINLQVANGEFVFLVGPSGAGKSTLLRLLYMEDTPGSGQIVVGHYLSTRMKRSTIPELRRRIGIIFQDFRLLEDRNVFENVALALKVGGVGMGDIKRSVTDILSRVGLYHKRYEFPHALSGGEQQRVAIARAVANRPAVLLADEPTGNLDPVVTRSILELLFKINAGGTAVLMATHDMELVRSFGQRIIYLDNGRIVRDKEMIYMGDLRDRIDSTGVSRNAERFRDREITDNEER